MKLWEPSAQQIAKARVTSFMRELERAEGCTIEDFHALYRWSVAHPERFWRRIWEAAQFIHEGMPSVTLRGESRMPGAEWFPGTKLNFAENLLRFQDGHEAIVFWNELGLRERLTYRELSARVASYRSGLEKLGIGRGDRIAGLLPNIPEAMVAMLATACVGGVWSSCSPDFTVQGVTDRFGQIAPKVLFTVDAYLYKGKWISLSERISQLIENIPSIEHVVVIPYGGQHESKLPKSQAEAQFTSNGSDRPLCFDRGEPSRPVYILYSSGTTGAPKCIVHGAIGMLIEHYKELALHVDLGREDRIFYGTTCGWMMWNWLASGLQLGATVVLYDGYPLAREGRVLFDLIEQERVSVFGTSAGYLQKLEELGLSPRSTHDLSSLRSVLSTGSRLKPHSFEYVYRDWGSVHLSPIWGGTDLCGCLGLGATILPVFRDELQTRSLGIDVAVVNEVGREVFEEPGEVVVRAPFPSMPVHFLHDPDGAKYHGAYFSRFPGKWAHGDWAMITSNHGMVILGRSDDTLNPGGIRIGSAEVTSAAERVTGVVEAMAVAQRWRDDERIVLFLILEPGITVTSELVSKIYDQMPSPRHRPRKIIAVRDLPTTVSGKRSARAIRDAINGVPLVNREALLNPDLVDEIAANKELKEE